MSNDVFDPLLGANFGTDVSTYHDMDLDGTFSLIGGSRLLFEYALRRLEADPGDLEEVPDWGVGIYNQINGPMGNRDLERLASRISVQLADDDRIQSVDVVPSFNHQTRTLFLRILLRPRMERPLSFVLSVKDVSLSILQIE
jgi:hypothetical protein